MTLELYPTSRALPADELLDAGQRETARSRAQLARLAARHGRTGVQAFIASADVQGVDLLGGVAASGYARVRRWAVTPGDVVAPVGTENDALDEYLDVLGAERLRPVFLAVVRPDPFVRRGFDTTVVADEAVIDLPTFSLAGSRLANLRHSTTSGRRAGLSVLPYAPWQDRQIEEISHEWLSSKRGGELGFTLSRYSDVAAQVADKETDLWVVADDYGTVHAWCTWRHYLGGHGRVVDVMRRRLDAPNPAMDMMLATVLEKYREAGLQEASLASVPCDHGDLADRIYPSRSLRAYKQKFDPRWEPRWLAVPAAWQRMFALAAVATAYCPGGLRRAVFRNR